MTEEWPNFGEVDWKDLYPRLLLAAEARLSRVRWRGRRWAAAPMGLQAKDFVQAAVLKAMNGERGYDVGRSLFRNLCQIISSDVSNVVQSYENRHVEHADDEKVVDIRDYRETPEDDAVHSQATQHLLAYLGERDGLAKQVAEQIIVHECVRTAELSVELRRSAGEIENIKKRLRRLCIRYRQEHGHESEFVPLKTSTSAPGGRA